MIITNTGKLCDGFYALGSPTTPIYLLDGPVPVLFDGGFSALALQYKTEIKAVLKGRSPVHLFLTHSHFDHIGSVGPIKTTWPGIRISGSEKCRDILANPRAVQLMTALSREGTRGMKALGVSPLSEDPFEPFDMDRVVEPDQKIFLSPGISLLPLNTPGHTRDFMSYWIPEKKILIASEAVAIYETTGHIQTEFLVDVDAYLDSLERLSTFDANVLCPGHYAVFTGRDATAHIQNSIQVTKAYLQRTERLLDLEHGNVERVVSRTKEMEWDHRPWPKQPESAYLINTQQRVKIIRERMS